MTNATVPILFSQFAPSRSSRSAKFRESIFFSLAGPRPSKLGVRAAGSTARIGRVYGARESAVGAGGGGAKGGGETNGTRVGVSLRGATVAGVGTTAGASVVS
jgi:hypothetical protein